MSNSWPVSSLIMLRPQAFGFNPENNDNSFAQDIEGDFQAMALQEFERVLFQLQRLGLEVLVLDDCSLSPDALFLNNWCSLHANGEVIYYPMKSPLRRQELQRDLPQRLAQARFDVRQVLDWSDWAERGKYLEGTGSMVLDPINHKVYAAISERTDLQAVKQFASHFNYEAVCFHSLLPGEPEAMPAYHTNVLMAIGQGFVLWCPEALPLEADRQRLKEHFQADQMQAIALSLEQIAAFAGNMLQVRTPSGVCLLMSHLAYQSLRPEQVQEIKELTTIQAFSIPTIEQVGGGSLRCMLLENALPRL